MLKKIVKSAPAAAAPVAAKPKPLSRTVSPAPAVSTKAAPAPAAKLKIGQKVEPVVSTALVTLISTYDAAVEVAEKSFIELVDYIQANQVDKATVIGSMMKARGITYETAQTDYSKMKKIYNNEEVLADLKAGKITLKVAREKVKTPQKNPKAAKTENKEAKFTNTSKAFVAAAKESGFSLKEILQSIEAELRSAGIK